jgi:N utilization substance protein A
MLLHKRAGDDMDANVGTNWQEMIQVAEAVARDKQIERELVVQAMEEAMEQAARSRYGGEYDLRVRIDRRTGYPHVSRVRVVVDCDVENYFTEIFVDEAKKLRPEVEVGGIIEENLPPLDFGRIAAQTAKQVIVQKVREAERSKQFEEFKSREGDVVNGIVKRIEYGNVIVDVSRGEAILRRDQLIPRENFHVGDRIRAFVKEVRSEMRGHQIFLSRTDPRFLSCLFTQEVPEIYESIIEIKAVARNPGNRAKIAVATDDMTIDPVGACVGLRGVRVQAVVSELQGEKIDIIPWSEDDATFIVNSLQPAEVTKVVLDEEMQRIEVVVPDDQLSLAIGRRGQNVRLASQLTGWRIDVMVEAEEAEKRQLEFSERTEKFVTNLDIDETIAQLLVSEGFISMDEVAYVELFELESIDGITLEMAESLQKRSREYLENAESRALEKMSELNVEEALLKFEGLTPQMIVALAENNILTLDDFAGLADWELVSSKGISQEEESPGILDGFDLTSEGAQDVIMRARVQLGLIDAEER